jgi:hypothetical protein
VNNRNQFILAGIYTDLWNRLQFRISGQNGPETFQQFINPWGRDRASVGCILDFVRSMSEKTYLKFAVLGRQFELNPAAVSVLKGGGSHFPD